MLDDAETYKSIVARLNDLGYPGFFEQNIQRWKDHGYQRWVQFQEKLEIARQETEEAEELAKDPKSAPNLAEANEIKLALKTSRLLDAVNDWDTDTTVKNGKFFFQLSRSTTQQLAERTKRERFKLDAEIKRRQQEISEEGKQKIRDLTNPLTQAERKAILDAIDDILGIRIDPDDDGARVSPPAAMQENTISPDQSNASNLTARPIAIPSPGGEGQGEGGLHLPPSLPNNTVEKPSNSKAESRENTVENISPISVSSSEGTQPIPNAGRSSESTNLNSTLDTYQKTKSAGIGCGVVTHSASVSDSASVTPVASVPKDSTLRTPNSALTNDTVENPTDPKAENEKNTAENQEASTAVPSLGGEGQGEGGFNSQTIPSAPSIQSSTNPTIQSAAAALPPIPQIHRDPFPISPLATTPPSRKQPRNHIPLLDIYGQLIQWVPRDEELTIENVVGFGNRRGHNICWLNPKLVDPAPDLRNVPIVSWNGQILDWVPAEIEPFDKAEPIRSRRYLHYKIGWWEQAREDHPQYNSSVGCMVA